MAEEIIKSYNPLKMWGSWIGAVLGYFLGFIIILSMQPDSVGGFIDSLMDIIFIRAQVVTIPSAIVGFLIGWGIHSKIRK